MKLYKCDYYILSFIAFMVVLLLSFFAVLNYAGASDITLKWKAPETSLDGSDLNDLAGYKLYQGDKSGMPESEDLGNVLTVTKSGVVEGTCFEVTAYDTSGNESPPSNQACIGIPPKAPVMGCVTSICNQCVINSCNDNN